MTLRLIHLSDLHLGDNTFSEVAPIHKGYEYADSTSMRAVAQGAAYGTGCSTLKEEDDTSDPAVHCVVSGDLTADGSHLQLQEALRFIGTVGSTYVPKQGKPKTLALQYAYLRRTVILGNHDLWGGRHPLPWDLFLLLSEKPTKRAEEARKSFRGSDMVEFDREYKEDYPHKAKYPMESVFPAQARRTYTSFFDVGDIRIRLYLLDTMESQYLNAFARGHVSQTQWDALKTLLEKHAKEDKNDLERVKYTLRIAVTHHPVIYSGRDYPLRPVLACGKRAAEKLIDHGFSVVLSGHEHGPRHAEMGGLHQFVCGSSTQASRRKGSKRLNVILTYTLDGSVTVKNGSASCSLKISQFTSWHRQLGFLRDDKMTLPQTLSVRVLPL